MLEKNVDHSTWETIIHEHPEQTQIPSPTEPHSSLNWQEPWEKYEMPGLMPKDPDRPKPINPNFKPY